jgi:ABC-type multidrug transport system ATPase subunit
MIRVEGMTKRFGSKTAVDQLTFDVRPGVVTGFLGPNGSGKSTTMRCMLDLDRADSGTATLSNSTWPSAAARIPMLGSGLTVTPWLDASTMNIVGRPSSCAATMSNSHDPAAGTSDLTPSSR